MNEIEVIQKIRDAADEYSFNCGEPGIELAGQIVDFLASNTEKIDSFLKGDEGISDWDINSFLDGHSLSARCLDNKIRSPKQRRSLRNEIN